METNGLLKVTALLYFKDALVKQEYENCQELINSAKRFGAEQVEINELIAQFLKGEKAGSRKEANRIKGQVPSLKEGK